MKKNFLNNEIWILTFGGGFQRANVYKGINYSEKIRLAFRNALRKEIERLVATSYTKQMGSDEHIANIYKLVEYSRRLVIEGVTIPINFGIAQKLLNLYLKYQWCLGNLPEPTHFPVDRIIQEELDKVAKRHKNTLPRLKIEPWTQFEDDSKYKAVIDFAQLIIDQAEEFGDFTLAQLELELFDRKIKL